MGLAIEKRPFSIGFTVTTPSLGLFGDARRFIDIAHVATDSIGSAPPGSDLGSTNQENISPDYRSPFSTAAGCTYRWQNWTLNFTVEWFAKIPLYTAIDTEPFVPQTGTGAVDADVVQELDSVFNWGIGVEQIVDENLAFYAALFSDRTGYVSKETSMLSASTWDIHHLSVGSVFNFKGIDFTAGFSYGHGSGTSDRFVNFEQIGDNLIPLQGEEDAGSLRPLQGDLRPVFPLRRRCLSNRKFTAASSWCAPTASGTWCSPPRWCERCESAGPKRISPSWCGRTRRRCSRATPTWTRSSKTIRTVRTADRLVSSERSRR